VDAHKTHVACRFTDAKEAADWADGYEFAYDADADSKLWWKSKTMLIGLALLAVGMGIMAYGWIGGGVDSGVYKGLGGGIGGTSLVTMALRLITGTSVTLTSGDGGYSPPPFAT